MALCWFPDFTEFIEVELGHTEPHGAHKVRGHVGVKIGEPRVGGPKLWILDQWRTRDGGHDVYPSSGRLEEVKPYVLLDYIEVYRMITESIYHEIR